jgi:eukaryotic-like serine/threonine-protein kinase
VTVADFGSATLMDPAKLRELGITNLGFTRSMAKEDESLSGTLMYMAPEVLGGQSPTASADVYALGVMLWQVTVGDFRRPLSPGWEAEISDELIREDIAAAASGDPAKRLNSAAELAERLSTLDVRRAHRNELAQAEFRAEVAERELADARARRPWIWFATAALIAGLAASLFLYREALLERDIAKRQTNITNAINLFLADDLLGRSNPFQSGKAAESLVDAVNQASASIDSQFKNAPEVAARLHHTIAKALDSRTNYADARREYERAVTLYLQTEGPLSQNAIEARLQRAFMEARSYEGTALKVAKDLLAQEEALLPRIKNPKPELDVWRLSTQGMISLVENDAKAANQQFKAALDGATALSSFDENAKLAFEQRLAFTYIRLGDGAKAEALFRELIDSYSRLTGPGSPNVLRVRLNLAQALMIQRKYQESIDEASAIYPAFVAGLGPEHDLTMQLLSTRAESEGSIEMWDAAIRDNMGIYKIASAKQGPASFYAVASLSDAGLAQCRSNQLAQGELNARNAYEIARKAFGEKAGITGGTADTLASCLIELNRLDEADKLLRSIDTPAVAQITGMPDWGANITLADAEIAYRRGDYAKARQLVESAAPAMTRPDAEAYQRRKLQMLQVALSNKAQQNARN